MLKIHKASAGSGKTYTLAREYLRLLLGYTGEDGRQRLRPASAYGFGRRKAHSAILAVTFTNKATEEMIQRIVKELYNLSRQGKPGAPHSNYIDEFCRVFDATPRSVAEASARALSDLLFNFSYFNVSTLDSFFQTIVRSFARDLDLPENYSLEISQEFPVASSVADMFTDLNRPEAQGADRTAAARRRHLEHTIEQFMLQEAADGRGAQLLSRSSGVFGNVVSFINSLINETWKFHRHEMEEYLSDPARVTAFRQALYDASSQAVDDARRAARAILDFGADRIVRSGVLKFCESLCRGERPRTLPADVTKALDGRQSPLKNVRTKADTALRDAVGDSIETAVSAFAPLQRAMMYDYVRRNLYLLSLFGHATRSLSEYCHENETFLLGDTNDLLRDLIDEAEAPFIYDRVGSRIEHFLIDEFQDTSRMQWENLHPLVLESMSRGLDNLIIGDEKQCIYRFRNSDPELLGHVAADSVAARFGRDAIEQHGHTIDENTNWRSAPLVVRFNNTLYRALAAMVDEASLSDGVTAATYAGLVQKIPDRAPGAMPEGYVEARFFPAGDEDYAARSLDALTASIERQLAAGYTPGDIAVLVRGRKEGKQVIEHLLRRVNAPDWRFGPMRIVSSDSLAISANPSVKTVINLLRLIITPETVADITRTDADGNPVRVINGEWLRRRLIHRYQLALYDSDVPRTPAEALALALEETMATPTECGATTDRGAAECGTPSAGSPAHTSQPGPAAPASPAAATHPSRHSAIFSDPESLVNCPNLFELVERLIAEALTPRALERDCAFITALQDLVLDYQDTGHNDVESFLEWWDSTGSARTLSAPEGLDALSVMTIHKAKGLEFPCVHVPFMDRTMDYVNPSDRAWYTLDPDDFPGIDPALIPPVMPLPQTSTNRSFEAFAPQYETTVRRSRLDSLNVAYVATTRAVNELCIYAQRATKPDSERLGERIRQAMERATPAFVASDPLAPWLTPLASDKSDASDMSDPSDAAATDTATGATDCELFTFGHPTAPISAAGATKNAGAPEVAATQVAATPNCGAGNAGAPQPTGTPQPPLSPLARYAVAERGELSVDIDPEAGPRDRGTFLHSVLASVRHRRDLPAAIRRAAYRRHLSEADEAECRALLTRALDNPRVRHWFEGFTRVVNERPASVPGAVKRPDRVVWHPDGSVSVIDYKFGHHRPRRYFEQVRDYVGLLSGRVGGQVRGYLWYPLSSEIIPVK